MAAKPKPKSHSQPPVEHSKSSAPPSRAQSVAGTSPETRTPRRKKKKKVSKSNTPKPERSNGIPNTSTTALEHIPETEPEQPTPSTSKIFQDDFIAFTLSEAEEEDAEEVMVKETPVREWDKGKARARDSDAPSSGQKRKMDEIDFNDGYSSKKQRMDAASRRAPWVWDVDMEGCTNVAQMLHIEVDAFVKYISPTPVEDEVRLLIVSLVSNAVTIAFPDAQVLPFGSYETKLYLPLGDIDLVILSDSMAYSRTDRVLHALANTVKRAGLTDKVTIIGKAKVPIIKFITSYGRFSVDISVNQKNGVAAGKIIKHFLRELPALRSLVLIIKSFLSQRSMNEVFTGGLGSYSIVCLAVSFLQMHPKIRRGEIDPQKNLGVLVIEFFELYGCYFNYKEVGISLRDGGTYYNKCQRGWLDYRSPGLLSIEDPGDPSNDISRGTYAIAKVRTALAGAHGIMTTTAYNHAEYIASRREHRTARYHHRRNPEELSILASVMGVTQETINHRKLVQEVYNSRVLHRMLGVEPRVPVTVDLKENGPKSARKSTSRAYEESVKSAWNDKEVERESDEAKEVEDVEEEEESRYGIADQPPRKRKRTGKSKDLHTVYVSDDEDEEGELSFNVRDDGGVSEEGSEYVVSTEDDDPESVSSRKYRTRSYWLSKGVGISESDGE